jgi:hypothetical protein
MNIFQNAFKIDEIELACNLIEPQHGSQPSLVVILSIRDRSQQRERELYLPLQCYFQLVWENGQIGTIGSGVDITDYPQGLSDIAVPRAQPKSFTAGTRLDPVTVDRISTIARHKGTIQVNVRFVGLLLNNVRTLSQRMYGFVPYFQFTIERDTWNSWLTRWREAYIPSDLPSTIPEHIAADFSEGLRCEMDKCSTVDDVFNVFPQFFVEDVDPALLFDMTKRHVAQFKDFLVQRAHQTLRQNLGLP